MENLEAFRLQLVFRSILHALRNPETPLSPIVATYVADARDFLGLLVRSLASLGVDPYESDPASAYQFVPNLREVIETTEHAPAQLDKKQVEALTAYFEHISKQLQQFQSDPRKVASGKDSLGLQRFCSKIADIYSENYNVLSESDSLLQYA